MEKVMVHIETTEVVRWPGCCVRCGQNLSKKAAAHAPKQSSSNNAEIAAMRKYWGPLDTDHLLAVWVKNDEAEWRAETFQVIKKILEERKVVLPPQRSNTATLLGMLIDITTERGLAALFLASTPKKIAVRLCQECGLRTKSSGGILRGLGYAIFILTIAGTLFAQFVFDRQYKFNYQGAGASLFLGVALEQIGKKKQRNTIGVRAKRISKTLWMFSFRCKDVATEFDQLNRPHVV